MLEMNTSTNEYKYFTIVMQYTDGTCFSFRVRADSPVKAMKQVLDASEIEVYNCCSIEVVKEEAYKVTKDVRTFWEKQEN